MGETCDDGNMVAGDGCGATCAIEGSFSKCPSKYGGVGFALVDKLVFSGSTVGLSNITKTACGGNSADDAIFEVMPAKTGNVQVVFTPLDGFQAPIIGFRGGCTTVPLGCNEVNPQLGYSATRGVTAGVPLYVILTGSSGSEGPYTLSLAYL
jgi:cysteine-rich repeat protein